MTDSVMKGKQRILFNATTVGMTDANDAELLWQCEWNEVREIVAWKEDVFAYDLICIGLRISNEPNYLRVHEEADGWEELIEELERRYGVGMGDWWTQVAFPAFKENWTVLWSGVSGKQGERTKPPV